MMVVALAIRFAVYILGRLWLSWAVASIAHHRMIAFEVYVNKVKVCTAGLDELEFFRASVICSVNLDGRPDERRIHFCVQELKEKKQYEWVRCELQKGNRVEIRIVDTCKIDEPKELACSGGSGAT